MWSKSIEVLNPYEALVGEKKKKLQTNADCIRAMGDMVYMSLRIKSGVKSDKGG